MSEYKRVFDFVVRAISGISLWILMSSLYQEHDNPGSHYLHPRHPMQ
ncbi:uncharacterized protein LOC117783141 [Drosophila innubila]|nr:uncharacterized protein LOC117783141 [Drosophila innubila]